MLLSANLPKFSKPPLIETVLGVQFNPLRGLGNAQLGWFWKRLGTEWEFAAEVPPLEPQYERFDPGWARLGMQLKLTQDTRSRLQVRSQSKDRMLQIQNGRLLYNWLGQGGTTYPHYAAVKQAFDGVQQEFTRFLSDEKLGELQPNQWEVTYVNHLVKGTVWNELADCSAAFRVGPLLNASPGGTKLETFGGEWHYEIPKEKGRLHVQLRHGKLAPEEGPEVLILTLTARGPVNEEQNLSDGLNCGHETIVRGFFDLTSESAHMYWGLLRDAH